MEDAIYYLSDQFNIRLFVAEFGSSWKFRLAPLNCFVLSRCRQVTEVVQRTLTQRCREVRRGVAGG